MPGPYSRRTDHPYLVESLQDLPEGLQKLAEQALGPADQLFYARLLLILLYGRMCAYP
ncbi:MAG: hypothetical protein JW726_13490 [Anaerolineales bacterium]|nr:hypothetical protein [Anaerolineales bacterium]